MKASIDVNPKKYKWWIEEKETPYEPYMSGALVSGDDTDGLAGADFEVGSTSRLVDDAGCDLGTMANACDGFGEQHVLYAKP